MSSTPRLSRDEPRARAHNTSTALPVPVVQKSPSDTATVRSLPPRDLAQFLEIVCKSGLVAEPDLGDLLADQELPDNPEQAAEILIGAGLLTAFQAKLLLQGKYKGMLLGPYKVLRPIGQGGMGFVYLAEHLALGRQVALKVLRANQINTPGALERFQREGRAAAALDHPNIVGVHDVCTAGTTHYLVMEYVAGQSLEALLQQKGRLPAAQAVNYAIQIAQGLRHAHERGIVHRDIKPANLLVDGDGTLKILDMGLARFYNDTDDDLTERLGGGILGSPDYIAPEQALGQLDIRSDIYSLGATLYRLLLGQPPFASGTVNQKLIDHQRRAVTPPNLLDSTIPVKLSQAVLRMLAKDPNARFQTPDEVIAALGACWSVGDEPTQVAHAALADTTLPEQPAVAVAPAARRPEKARWSSVAVVAALLGVALVGGLLTWLALSLMR